MPERDKSSTRPSQPQVSPRRDDDSSISRDPKVGRPSDSDSEESTPSRPHGTTEDPDRTL
jgi:hypothetical protein